MSAADINMTHGGTVFVQRAKFNNASVSPQIVGPMQPIHLL